MILSKSYHHFVWLFWFGFVILWLSIKNPGYMDKNFKIDIYSQHIENDLGTVDNVSFVCFVFHLLSLLGSAL